MSRDSNAALSSNINGMTGSATLAILERVQTARATGRSVIDLGIGEPSFATPAFIGDAAARAIADGKTRYTAVEGIAPLRDAIAVAAQELSGGNGAIDRSHVVVTCGSKQALFQSCFVLFGPGDEVLIPSPSWPSYMEMVRLSRATPDGCVCNLGLPASAAAMPSILPLLASGGPGSADSAFIPLENDESRHDQCGWNESQYERQHDRHRML